MAQKSLAGWHIALLPHVHGGAPFPGTRQQIALIQPRVRQLHSLRRRSLVMFTSPDAVLKATEQPYGLPLLGLSHACCQAGGR